MTEMLPGEDQPLTLATRPAGPLAPVTDAEVLGSARRRARTQAARGRSLKRLDVPDELPPADGQLLMTAHRLPHLLVLRAQTKAEIEGRTMSSVLVEALAAYVASSPGSAPTYRAPRGGVSASPAGPIGGRRADTGTDSSD